MNTTLKSGAEINNFLVISPIEINHRFETWLLSKNNNKYVLKIVSEKNPHKDSLFQDIRRQNSYLNILNCSVFGISRYLEIFEIENRIAILMNYVEGTLLSKLLEDTSWALESRFLFLESLANTIDEMHKFGILHRDISDKNIIVKPSFSAFLYDFDLSYLGPVFSDDQISLISGNAWYKSPEAWKGTRQNCYSDVFSFSLICLYVLTFSFPVCKSNDLFKLLKHLQKSFSNINIKNIFEKGLNEHPQNRPTNCLCFIKSIRATVI